MMGNNRAAQRLNDTGRIVQSWDLDSTLTPRQVCDLSCTTALDLPRVWWV